MTTDDGTGRLRHAGCEGEQNEGEHVEYCGSTTVFMSTCLVSNKTKVNMCVWAHACLHGTILAIKEGHTYIHHHRLEQLSVSDVSIYLVWFTQLLVVLDGL